MHQLEAEEKELHSRLHPEVERIVADKKILLFREMLASIQYDDMKVVDLLIHGVRMVGLLDRIGIWKPSKDKVPVVSKEVVWANARAAQRKVASQSSTSKYQEELWAKTMDEVGKSLEGPLSAAEMERR